MKKKYEDLDLIEKHRVQLWAGIRGKLHHHLESIEKKLEIYDISSLTDEELVSQNGGASLKELDSFFEKINKS